MARVKGRDTKPELALRLKAEILWQLEPDIQGDWKAPFRVPWDP